MLSISTSVQPVAVPQFSSGRDIANEAFSDALNYLELEFSGNVEALAWLKKVKSTTMDDLLETTQQVEAKYRQSAQKKNGFMKVVHGLSVRVMHYGQVLDTLAQHHPEYVALAWGMVKFILMGVINHGKLVTQFSQALSTIADVLPRANLSAELYQTDQMENTVAKMYAHILLFLKRAMKWYHAGQAGRALAGLFKPYELSFKDTVEQIVECAKAIDDIASISNKVEVRQIGEITRDHRLKLTGIEDKLQGLTATVGNVLQCLRGSSTKINEIYIDMKFIKPRIGDMHFKDMLDVLKPDTLPEHSLRKHKSIVCRASSGRNRNQNVTNILQAVGQWISSSQSSLLILQAQPRARVRVKEIATEVIGLLRPKSKHVIWYLSNINADQDGAACATEVFRNLVFQLVKLTPDFVSSSPDNFNLAKLSASHSEEEWLGLLCQILRQLPACFVIIEAEDVWRNEGRSGGFTEILVRLSRHLDENGTSAKLLVVSYNRSWQGDGNSTRVIEVAEESRIPVPRGLRRSFRGRRGGIGRRA